MILNDAIEYLQSNSEAKVTDDSRTVCPGDIFVAVYGSHTDGHEYIASAIEKGARIIICEQPVDNITGPIIITPDTHHILALLSHVKLGNPSEKLQCFAVTGTNGKTTVNSITKQILTRNGIKTGLIGTVENDLCSSAGPSEAAMTTPPSTILASMLAKIVDNGGKAVCIEASSHALEQKRLDCINFKAAAFTNLTGDHLDYHKTMKNYFAAKKRLFHDFPSLSTAVVNIDNKYGKKIAKLVDCDVIAYSIKSPSAIYPTITAEEIKITDKSIEYNICFNGEKAQVQSEMSGLYNVSNQLAAAGLCVSYGLSLTDVADGLSICKAPKGRLQRVECDKDFTVFVDYAHTDDALENVLKTIKGFAKGKVITVFGCGGDRDATKRPRMATVSEEYSDISIVTDDNPRTENSKAIIDAIIAGFSGGNVIVEQDREKAIKKAIELATSGDIVLIAGKGHEDYQIIGTTKRHFSDYETARKYLE